MFCPLYTNQEVFDQFNEIVEAFGGRALTEEEFRSSELRNQREGLDLQAVNAAYAIWDMNNGYPLDKARNGEQSLLFQALLEKNNGDRAAAINEKSYYYTNEYFSQSGNWIGNEDVRNKIINSDGEIDWNYFEQLLDNYHNRQPDSMFSHGRYTLSTRPENHFSEEKNTLNHIKFVTQSMLNLFEGQYDMDLPFVSEARASMQNQKDLMVLAAMFHDAAKPYRHGDIHGWESADILRDVLGIDYNNRLAEWAVRHHMPMPFSHKAEFSSSNPEALEVAKNIAMDAKRIGIDANTAINAFVLINAADVINGRELNVDDNWAKKAGEEGLKKYNGDISVKNVLSVELKEKVQLLKQAFDEIKNEDLGDPIDNYNNQKRFNYVEFPEGGREDKKLPYLNNIQVLDQNGEPISEYQKIQSELNASVVLNESIGLRNQLNRADPLSQLGPGLLSGQTVSTKEVLNNMLQSGSINPIDINLANILIQHDVPVRLQNLEPDVLGTTITDENGGSVIILNKNLVSKVSSGMLSTTLLHEILHAVTLPALLNPVSDIDRFLSRNTSRIYRNMKKIAGVLAENHQMFDNEQEFLSIFITDKNERQFIYDIARSVDESERNTIKSIIKKFINSITNKLFDSVIFKSNVEQLQQYAKTVNDYLYNVQPIYKGNLTNKQLIDAVYNNYDVDVMNYDKLVERSGQLDSLLGRLHRNNLSAPAIKNDTFEDIARYLLTRLDRMKRSSANVENVEKQTQVLEYQADLITKVSYADKLAGLQAIAQNVEPQMNEYKKYIQEVTDKTRTLTPEEFQYIFHEDIGTYKVVVKQVLQILEDPNQVQEFVRAMYDSTKDKKDITTSEGFTHYTKFERRFIDSTIKPLLGVFNDISAICTLLENKLQIINQDIVRNSLGDILNAVKDPDAEAYLDMLAKTETDASILWNISPMDMEQDAALRSIAHIIRKANKTADLDAYNTMIPLAVELQNLSKLGIQLRDFYERDDKGRTTGYLIRPFNYGMFYDEYTKKMEEINDTINKKYGLKLLPSNRTSPDDSDARKEWNALRNDWLKKNSIRKFTDKYYDLMGDLPSEAVRQLQSINRQIFQINNLPSVKGKDDKYPNYYNLTKEQWDILQECLTRKRQLRSDYDEWGNLKTPEQLKSARALQAYYDALSEHGKEGLKKDTEMWEQMRSDFLESLGASGFYDKSRHFFDEQGIQNFMKDHPAEKEKWDLWNTRNSRLKFKEDENGEALIFKRIQDEMAAARPFYGPEEEELTKKIKDLLGVFYGTNGHVYDQAMSLEIQKKINALYSKRAKLRYKLKKQVPGLAQQAAKYGAIIKKYLDFEETERYKQLKQDVLNKANQYEDPALIEDTFYTLMKQYAHIIYDYDSGMIVGIRPFKWFTRMVAKDRATWMEYTPGDSFTDFANSASFKNPEFEKYEKYHVSYVPKGKRFDNSKNFNKVKDSDFYGLVVGVMEKGYGNMKNRQHSDPYLLPQITGGMYKQMSAHQGLEGRVHGAMHWVKDNIGLNGVTQNDSDYGSDDINPYDEPVNEESMSDKFSRIGTLQNMPDGKVSRIIPQFYIKRKNPEYISNDLLGILSVFYTMTARYKYKSEKKDEIETIIDMLENREYVKYNEDSSRQQTMKGDQTRNYKKARKYADMQLYGMKLQRGSVKVNKTMTWEYTKTLQLLKNYTTANNLGANPKVAMVGFLTTTYGHIINAFCGNGYGGSDATFGAQIVSEYVLKNTVLGPATLGMSTDVGKMLSDSSLVNLMEMFNLANQFERKFKHSNWNRLQKAIYENSVYGMLASADFLAKATILVSVLHSFRLVDGEFINRDDIYRRALSLPEDKRDEYIAKKLTVYNNASTINKHGFGKKGATITLYDVFSVKDKQLVINPEYKSAVDSVFYKVQSIAEKLAERADGMATEEQKALWTQSIIGSLALIHRQYLPLQIAERFSKPVYDMDMEMYKGGQFYQIYKYIQAIGSQSTKNAAIIGSMIGAYAFNPLFGLIAGGIVGGGIGKLLGKHEGRSLKDINKQFFSDYSSEKSTLLSRHNRKIRRQLFLELAICKLISMFAAFFCKWMDEPENKNDKILQFLALVLRQLEWETFSPYRGDDMISQVKSLTAASGTSDDIQNAFSLVEGYSGYMASSILSGTGLASSPIGVLYDTISLGNEQDIFREMRSGPYEGLPYYQKIGAKLFPWSNWYEQYYDSKGKRKYLENQIFKLNTTTGTKK